MSLFAVGQSIPFKARAAYLSGVFQVMLGAGMMAEVLRRGLVSGEPDPIYMIFVSLVALLANVACLVIITAYRERDVHMGAAWIFSKNDILGNLGVIAAGGLVSLTASAVPDLLIGCLISAAVMRGGFLFITEARKTRSYQLD
ncbi:MAG: cation transporter [Pseudomonadota bacterium]